MKESQWQKACPYTLISSLRLLRLVKGKIKNWKELKRHLYTNNSNFISYKFSLHFEAGARNLAMGIVGLKVVPMFEGIVKICNETIKLLYNNNVIAKQNINIFFLKKNLNIRKYLLNCRSNSMILGLLHNPLVEFKISITSTIH